LAPKCCENLSGISQYIHATALLMEENKESYIPFREHQHAFAATIHYTMLIAAEILIEFAKPSHGLSQIYNDCIYLQAILHMFSI
jgi:hypothetical protein